VLFSHI